MGVDYGMRQRLKRRVSWLFDTCGLNQIVFEFHRRSFFPYIRVINYHGTPARHATSFERQLQYFAERFVPSAVEDLRQLLSGTWNHTRPGILITFDDGIRNNIEVAVPILEKYGFKAIFFVPPGFVEEPSSTVAEFCKRNMIEGSEALTIDDIRYLSKRHYIGSHSYNHVRLSDDLSAEEIQREVVESKKRLEEMTEEPVNNFCWVGGEEWSYGRTAARQIESSGYEFSFMSNSLPVTCRTNPFWLQRTNVELDWPLELVRFQLSGIPDLWHWGKRRRLRNRLL